MGYHQHRQIHAMLQLHQSCHQSSGRFATFELIVEHRNVVDDYHIAFIFLGGTLDDVNHIAILIGKRGAVVKSRYGQKVAEGVAEVGLLIGVAHLKLLLAQLEVVVVHLLAQSASDVVGYLHRKYRFADIGVSKEACQLSFVPKSIVEGLGHRLETTCADSIVGLAKKHVADGLGVGRLVGR